MGNLTFQARPLSPLWNVRAPSSVRATIPKKSFLISTAVVRYTYARLIPNPLSRVRGACNKVPVLSGQCNFLDNEFIPSNLVTFESYLLDIFSSITSCLSTEQFFMILELAGVKRNVIENVVSFCSIL